MRSLVLAIITLSLSFTFCYSQDQPDNKYLDFKHKNTISFSGTLHQELIIYYERQISRRSSLELGLGRKLGSFRTAPSGGVLNLFNEPFDQAGYYKGTLYSFDYKYYFKEFKSSAFYLSSLIFYKDYAFNKKSVQVTHLEDYKPNQYYENQIRSSKKEVYGGKLLIGYQQTIALSDSKDSPVFVLFDFFAGIGLRAKKFTDYVYATGTTKTEGDFTTTPLEQPQKVVPDKSEDIVPSLHLGLKLGFNF